MIKLLKDVPQEVYKKKLGYNFTAFEIPVKEITEPEEINANNMWRGMKVVYKNRQCVVSSPAIYKGSSGWWVAVMLLTNKPNDYIK